MTVRGGAAVSGPFVDRSLTVRMQADWGAQNLTRVCGWLGQELTDRSAPGTRVAIWNGRGFVDNVRAVGRGEVDLAVATPAAFVVDALTGRGAYAGEAFPHLRALGSVPQRDRLVVGVRTAFGIRTFAELRAARPALRVATAADDGVHHVGLAAREVLARSGVDVEGWGGEFLYEERPFETFDHVLAGRADAIAQEAIMLPAWQEMARLVTYLPIEDDVLRGLDEEHGWPAATIPAGWCDGVPDLRTLDFSDFLVVVRDDLPGDVASTLAWILGETRHVLEQQYAHLPPERSPVTYPLDPSAMGRTPIPLHPGAVAYYAAYDAAYDAAHDGRPDRP